MCVAEIARANGDLVRARTYYAKADEWQRNVDAWTFTTTGFHGNAQNYIRINADQNPNDGNKITIGNNAGNDGAPDNFDERSILDGGFL